MFDPGDIVECIEPYDRYPHDARDHLIKGAVYTVEECFLDIFYPLVHLKGMFFGVLHGTEIRLAPAAHRFRLLKKKDDELVKLLMSELSPNVAPVVGNPLPTKVPELV